MPPPPPLLKTPSRPLGINRRAGASNGQHKTPPMLYDPSHLNSRLNPSQTASRSSNITSNTTKTPTSTSKSCSCDGPRIRSRRHYYYYYYYYYHYKRPYQSQLVFLLVLSIVSLAIVRDHLPGSTRNNKINGNNNNISPFLQVHGLQIDWPSSASTNSHHQQQQQLSISQLSAAAAAAATAANGGLQQHQLLQVFNGNESQIAELNRFKIMEIYGDFILIGARNILYNISLSTMREVRRIEWPASDEDIRLCRIKGKSVDQCQNYIKVLKWFSADASLYVCGTNAYKPRCRTYFISDSGQEYKLASESSGEGICPYQESQEVTTLLADGHLYSATTAQFSGLDGLIHRNGLRTDQFNARQLNSPKFVSSFQYREHVYFIFKEVALEHTNCGKTVYSRIGRVCKNDKGGAMGSSRERLTSFAKARLNCSINGDYPFYLDQVQAVSQIISSPSARLAPSNSNNNNNNQNLNNPDSPPGGAPSVNMGASGNAETDVFYAVFTTPPNSIGGSAVCAYRMSDVLQAFEGPFKGQEDINYNWLPIPESRLPSPRPGTCVNDSKRLPEDYVSFIRENSLMDTAIEALWSQPLVTMASINFNFTSIAIDPQVEAASSSAAAIGAPPMRTDVIFVGSSDGRVFKLINTHHLFGRFTGLQNPALLAAQTQSPITQPAPSIGQPYSSALKQTNHLINTNGLAQQQQQQQTLDDISRSTIILEELHLFDAKTPIVSLAIREQPNIYHATSQSKLFVLSSKQLKVVPLARCERALTCSDCLALYDPYCVWDSRQNVCLALGRSQQQQSNLYANSLFPMGFQADNRLAHQLAPTSNWFPPNNPNNNLNFMNYNQSQSFAWWQSCPGSEQAAGAGPPTSLSSVGPPFKSLFSSHLQVPSRFDYASGHHLAHTSLLTLFTSNQQQQQLQHSPTSTSMVATSVNNQAPVSECLTFCGGLYAPPSSHLNPSASPSSSCGDYVASHYMPVAAGSVSSGSSSSSSLFALQQAGLQVQSLHSSESLYFAVILCALFGILLGLLFGFALGRNAKKHDSSVCSSTFDENNLYMASTGSHTTANLFGLGNHAGQLPNSNQSHHNSQQPRYQPHHPLIQHQQQHLTMNQNSGIAPGMGPLLASGGGGANGAHFRSQNNANLGSSALYESCDNDYAEKNAPQQQQQQQNQFLLTLATNNNNNNNNNNNSSTDSSNSNNQLLLNMRTGALPPIPAQQQALINNSSTMISQTSQLTPNSLTGVNSVQQHGKGSNSHHNHQQSISLSSNSCSTNTSCSTSATASAIDPPLNQQQQNQLYLNQQQQQMLFQSTNLNNKTSAGNNNTRIQDPIKCKQQQPQQLQQQSTFQPQQNNKIYL